MCNFEHFEIQKGSVNTKLYLPDFFHTRGSEKCFVSQILSYAYIFHKYNLNIYEFNKYWWRKCSEQNELTRLGYQIKELCMLRDSPYDNFLSRTEAQALIDVLCTE